MPSILPKILLSVATLVLGLIVLEGMVRLGARDGNDYHIEMWKYSTTLKRESATTDVVVEHIPNTEGRFQNVDIRINNLGLRGPDIPEQKDANTYRVLVLGSSVTLGWGVAQENVYTTVAESRINDMLTAKDVSKRVQVINAGVGNYNAKRSIAQFYQKAAEINPDLIILSLFARDAEDIAPPSDNFLFKNSALVVTAWAKWQYLKWKLGWGKSEGEKYKNLYAEGSPARQNMFSMIEELADYSRKNGMKLAIAMTPFIDDFDTYPFLHVHEAIKSLSEKLEIPYEDLLEYLRDEDARSLWNLPGDPHPNARGHELMAKGLEKLILEASDLPITRVPQ